MNRRTFSFAIVGSAGSLLLRGLPGAGGAEHGACFPKDLRVNGARLNQHIAALAEFGKNPQGGVSRVAYSEADARGRQYVMGLMRAKYQRNDRDAHPPVGGSGHLDALT